MIRKTLVNLSIILFMLMVFSGTIFATTSNIEELKTNTEKILNMEVENNAESITNYYNSLMQIKEELNNAILEKTENTEELQKLKYEINVRRVQLEEIVKINYVENDVIKYTGYIPTMLGVNVPSSARDVTILEYIRAEDENGSNIDITEIAFVGAGKYTDLKSTNCLFCQQHGGSLTSVSKSAANVDDGEDATLHVTGRVGVKEVDVSDMESYIGQRIEQHQGEVVQKYTPLPRMRTDEEGRYYRQSTWYQTIEGDSQFSYGDWRSTRSIAKFTASDRQFKEGSDEGAGYIIAHTEDNGGDYPSYVQQAYWLYQEGAEGVQGNLSAGETIEGGTGFAEDADGAGSTIEANAKQLAQEALTMEEERTTALGSQAQNTSDMNGATVVYNLNEHCWYAGPFKLNYERKVLKIESGATSKLAEKQKEILANKVEGLVEYRGINSIKFYDENGRELQGVQFVITNKGERQDGDEAYKFPYPNEEFYIKIPYAGNESAKEFEKMEVELFDMYSEGQGSDLEGTYQKLGWERKRVCNTM